MSKRFWAFLFPNIDFHSSAINKVETVKELSYWSKNWTTNMYSNAIRYNVTKFGKKYFLFINIEKKLIFFYYKIRF